MVAQKDGEGEMHTMLETIVEEIDAMSIHDPNAPIPSDMVMFLTVELVLPRD